MTSNRNTSGSAVPPGVMARVAAGIRTMLTGAKSDAWFGPNQPMPPVAQGKTEGRQFDYAPGWNIVQGPKQDSTISFGQLRAIADGYDLIRLVIESRKDQLANLEWSIKPKSEDTDPDQRCADITAFFQSPDKEHDWDTWLRAIVEDLLVCDAPCLYPRMTNGGELYSLDLMDGATIKRLLNDDGRTPVPPDAAYQQFLKGMPGADYTRDELMYMPRNVRSNRVYGYSPVEQVIITVNIAMQRQLSQLSYYTDGSTPDLLFGVPDDWQPDQIRTFQAWWDSLLAGNTQARRGAKFIPGGITPINTKEGTLKDEFDDWLARIICYAFSVNAHAFIKGANRSVTEQAGKEAHEEGLMPLMKFVKNFMNRVLVRYFNAPDLEFTWKDDAAVDPLVQAQIDVLYVGGPGTAVKTPDEVRASIGLPPFTAQQKADMLAAKTPPAPPVDPNAPPGAPPGGQQGAAKPAGGPPGIGKGEEGTYLGKARAVAVAKRKSVRAISRSRPALDKATKAIAACTKVALAASLKHLTAQAVAILESRRLKTHDETVKADAPDALTEEQILSMLEALSDAERDSLVQQMQTILGSLAMDGADEAATQIGLAGSVALDLVNTQAVAWADNRAAEMVGMKWVGEELVPNPNAEWVITTMQREVTARLITQALKDGVNTDDLADQLAEEAAFSDSRADMIARTETAMADSAGNMSTYRTSGIVTGKEWVTGGEVDCDECNENADAGVIGLNDEFPSGDDTAPAHPNCRCDVLPSLMEEHDDGNDDENQPADE